MAASVSQVAPNAGTVAGGTLITLTGPCLALTTTVTIGGAPATNVTIVNSTVVTALTPPGTLGNADVVIGGGKGTITVLGGFRYTPTTVPSWATLVEDLPDLAVVTDATMRAAITSSHLAWRVRDTATQMEMLLVPSGSFTMGCSQMQSWPPDGCSPWEEPRHTVTLTKPFYMGRYEVTQAQWQAKMGSNPSYFRNSADSASRPVEQVSWNDVQNYLAESPWALGMRLPSEAEWEFACRAGTTSAFHNGSDNLNTLSEIAWYTSNSDNRTHAVGGKSANALGLHDMSGNVLEFVNDWFGMSYYEVSPATNPLGPSFGDGPVARGGSFAYQPTNIGHWERCSSRAGASSPSYKQMNLGFRVVRNP
jgi:formylglycine-generating enzyme required for sulfatase activity